MECQLAYRHCVPVKLERSCAKDHFVIVKMTFQEFSSSPNIVNPGLLPLLCSAIVRVKTFACIINSLADISAFPIFKDDTTIQDQIDLAVAGLLTIFCIYVPFPDPKIKLPVNGICCAWGLLRYNM